MRGHLIERLPPGAPAMADFDARVAELDARLSLSREYQKATIQRYMRGYRRYVDWCREVGEQPDPELTTTEKMRRFAEWMCSVRRYTPQTVWKNIRGTEWLAERAGADVTTKLAYGVLDSYRKKLRDPEVAATVAAAPAGVVGGE